MHRGGDALTVTVGAGRVGRRRPMEEAILRVVVDVVETVEVSGGSCGGGDASTAACVGGVSVGGLAPMEVVQVVAAVQLQTLRLPPSLVSVSLVADRWK